MAEQTAQERLDGAGQFMRLREEADGLTKADIRAAYNALDTWLNANAAVINAALPIPFKTTASTEKKALLLQRVVADRYLNGA